MNSFFTIIVIHWIAFLLLPLSSTSLLVAAFSPCPTKWTTSTTRKSLALWYRGDAQSFPDTKSRLARPRSSVFKPWPFGGPNGKVLATGDYQKDLYLEEHIGGPLYSRQRATASGFNMTNTTMTADVLVDPFVLPKLPVPSLNETVHRLLPTVVPLACTQEDEKEEALVQDFIKAWQDFPSEAEHLHQRLVEHANSQTDTSWVQAWWQTQAYLQYRKPLSHHVSYYLMVPDDPNLQPKDDACPAGLLRGAAILHAVAESRKLICSGTLEPDTAAGNAPLCSVGFKYMFHASRIPMPEQDVYHLYDPARYSHAIVAVKGQFFAVDIVDENEDPLPLPVLQARLEQCQKMAETATLNKWPQLGWCTSLPRDEWTEARTALIEQSPAMEEALELVESAAFILNLDDEAPGTMTDKALNFWHGGSQSGSNRWFDKPMQILVTRNGHVAYQGEHSMVDAAPVITVIQRIVKTTYSRLAKRYSVEDSTNGLEATDSNVAVADEDIDAGVSNVFAECWNDPALFQLASQLSEKARRHHEELSADYDLDTVQFSAFGKKKAKQWGYDGPLLAQLAIQLAGYRLFGKMVATYEAASTRGFLHGRTEGTRPVLPETLAFVKTMSDDKATAQDKLDALKTAASKIGEYQSKACMGRGVDRHLFGLSNLLEDGEEAPKLFSDPLFQRSKKFRLSTSSVVFLPGFGPVEDDGLGVGFNAEKDSFVYTVTSRKENNYARPFCTLLEQALQEIGEILDAEKENSTP